MCPWVRVSLCPCVCGSSTSDWGGITLPSFRRHAQLLMDVHLTHPTQAGSSPYYVDDEEEEDDDDFDYDSDFSEDGSEYEGESDESSA